MDNVGLFLVIGIVGMVACVGLVVVGLLWKPAAKTDKARPAPAESAAAPAPASGPREVLRVLRDAATEELFVEVAGQRYSRMADIRQSSVREGFRSTLRDLEAFAGGVPTVPPVVVKPVPQPEPVPVTPSLTNVGAAKQAAAATTPGTGPLLAPSMNPFKQMLVLRDLAKVQLPTVKTIAEQIDEIVQEKLADSPLAQRGVKVHTGPKGNALFRADGQDYEAVDEVPDDEIRRLIRAAVAEWEKKQ